MTAVETGPLDALAEIDPFTRADPQTLATLRDEVVWRTLAPGEVLVEAGSEARELAVVVDGTLHVEVIAPDGTPTRIAELGVGAIVGEMALLLGGRRTAAVTAATPTRVVDLTATGFARLLATEPAIGLELTARATRRLRESQLATHVTHHFGSLPRGVLEDLQASIEHVTLAAGERLFAHGDVADAAYVVLSGRVRIVRPDEQDDGPLHELGAGALVGELALLDDDVRSADVIAVRDTALARLPREVFDRLVTSHPSAMLAMTRRLVALTRGPGTPRPSGDSHLSIVVVPQSPDVDVRLFTSQLVEALGREAFHVWSARVDSVLSHPGLAQCEPGGAEDARLAHWLHEAEQDHEFLVYEADHHWSPWTERACRQADEVLVVAHAANPDRSLGALEVELERGRGHAQDPRRTLVLLHEPGVEQPSETPAWLDGRQVQRHAHLRSSSRADMARLARILSGTATGLVLGGGGARGAAHLGVIRALREAGVPIDMYGGSSMGAVMAIPGILEWPTEEIVPRASTILEGLLDYTLPLVSLLKGEAITHAIDSASQGLAIEDLWVDYFCISTNLTRQTEMVHRRGDLAQATRASVAIPGVLPPVPFGDDLLIDAGSMNNLPVDRMRERNPSGTIIAVDVAPPRGPSAKTEVTPVISGWGQLAGRMVPGRRPVRAPGIMVTLLGSTIVAAMRDRNTHVRDGVADLYLDLDLRGHGLLDFDACAAIAEAGYEAAKPRIDAWLADRTGDRDVAADPA